MKGDTTNQDDEDRDSWKLHFALSSKECHDRGWITTTSFDEHEDKAVRAYVKKKLEEYIVMR